MHRFTITRKISDTLLGATYECAFNVPPTTTTTPTTTPMSTTTTTTTSSFRPRASVVIKRSSLVMHKLLEPIAHDDSATHQTQLDDPQRERRVVAALIASGGHANVLQCYDHFTTIDTATGDESVCVVTEFCGGGDLYDYLSASSTQGLGEHESLTLMLQVARGVAFLQSRLGLAHRDLSLENVLLRDGTCKVADFGLAVAANEPCHGRAGKQLYMAPEVVAANDTKHAYDASAADVWSLGVMLFMLLTGSPLVDVASHEDAGFMVLIRFGVGPVLLAWGVEASCGLVELLDRMLSEVATQRPTVAQGMLQLITLLAAADEIALGQSRLGESALCIQ